MRLMVMLTAIYATASMPTKKQSSESTKDGSWECGSDFSSKHLSKSQIGLDCPHLEKNVNGCCLKHDMCYADQLGQKLCDDTFCSCLDDVTKDSVMCNKEDSPMLCDMVREFGRDAYVLAGNKTLSHDAETDNQLVIATSYSH